MSGATLTLIFDPGNCEEPLRMVLPVSEHIAESIMRVDPPRLHGLPFTTKAVPLQSFEECAEVLRRRSFRKDLFVREAARIGALLAERMEDAEGWHDASRIEPAKRELRE